MLAKKVSNIHESTEYILSEIYRHGVILVRWVTRVPWMFDTILLTTHSSAQSRANDFTTNRRADKYKCCPLYRIKF